MGPHSDNKARSGTFVETGAWLLVAEEGVFIVKIEIRLKIFKGGSDGRSGVYNSRQAGN